MDLHCDFRRFPYLHISGGLFIENVYVYLLERTRMCRHIFTSTIIDTDTVVKPKKTEHVPLKTKRKPTNFYVYDPHIYFIYISIYLLYYI